MVTRGRGKGRGRGRGRERGRGQGQESDQGVNLLFHPENEELLGVCSSHVEQRTSSNALSREPELNTDVDETSVGLGNDPIIGESGDDITSQSRRRGPNRGSQLRYRCNDFTDVQMRKVWNENASARFREMIYKAKRKALENASKELGTEPSVLDMIGRGPDWMHTHIWDELVEKHWSGENYKGKCKITQKNRMTEKDGSITKHTGGSIPQGAHKLRMEKELGREVGELELFHRTHRRNKGTGEFVDNKSKNVNSLFDLQSWCEVTGAPSKGRIYGFGRSQSSDRYSRASVTSTFREFEERFNELRKEMDEKYNKLTMKMQEEFLRREEENKRILEQALEESRKREEDAQRRTLELEEMVCKLIQEVGYTNRQFAGGSGHKEQQDFWWRSLT
ncbi:UNVERIFIED_CONTAM: hypothetical protein Sradi_2083000 [Sesamum radiatum]|uniref:Transposase, Ptta/En/Spm, plant n=1 Tax=Sesamum radiatum TaxID=300843 RepID=A0AAW2TJD3_SESRA